MLAQTVARAAALVLCASTSSAAVMVNLCRQPDPAPGFLSYVVSLSADGTSTVGGVRGLRLTGVHQVWGNDGLGVTVETPEAATVPFGGALGNPEWRALDSHILPLPPTNTSPGYSLVETNDLSNPTGLDWIPSNPTFDPFRGGAGIGSLINPNLDSTIAFLSPQPTHVDFLQLVVPKNVSPTLELQVSDQRGEFVHRNIIIVYIPDPCIPEPATFGLGALALAGLGFRRRR